MTKTVSTRVRFRRQYLLDFNENHLDKQTTDYVDTKIEAYYEHVDKELEAIDDEMLALQDQSDFRSEAFRAGSVFIRQGMFQKLCQLLKPAFANKNNEFCRKSRRV